MIQGKDLTFSYGKQPIFLKSNFFVSKNSKVGLVGANGAGKSTLFRLITSEDEPDGGGGLKYQEKYCLYHRK